MLMFSWLPGEVDYIEEKDGQLFAYEFKCQPAGRAGNIRKSVRITRAFTNAYPDASTKIITPENFTEFLLPS